MIEGAVFAPNTWLVPKDAKKQKIREESVKWKRVRSDCGLSESTI